MSRAWFWVFGLATGLIVEGGLNYWSRDAVLEAYREDRRILEAQLVKAVEEGAWCRDRLMAVGVKHP